MVCHSCMYSQDVTSLTAHKEDYRQQLTFENPVHPDICLDPTLARTSRIPCPNTECPSRQKNGPIPECVMFHYNTDYAMGYICCHCYSFWK